MGTGALGNLSPLDGRYAAATRGLAGLFSERALILRKCEVELRWLEHLCAMDEAGPAPESGLASVVNGLRGDGAADFAARAKEIEARTNHDTKAVELLVAEILSGAGLGHLVPWVHFGCTSWDITNLANALALKEANETIAVPALGKVREGLEELADQHADTPMLARTHGQPASPTTLGKEFRVCETRLGAQLAKVEAHGFEGKFNGAVGNHNALVVAYPRVDWPGPMERFVGGLGLGYVLHTTQTGPHDGLVEYFDTVARANRVLLDLAQDMSLYVSLGLLRMRHVEGEVGSSTMPHKVNPIDFENAEGNVTVANSLLRMLAEKLQVSRMQRDLSDSTVMRNVGVAMGHCVVAWKSLARGLGKIDADTADMEAELDGNWQVLGEAVQTVLRTLGDAEAYERIKKQTRGAAALDREGFAALVKEHVPEGEARDALLKMSPRDYVGLAVRLARDGRR